MKTTYCPHCGQPLPDTFTVPIKRKNKLIVCPICQEKIDRGHVRLTKNGLTNYLYDTESIYYHEDFGMSGAGRDIYVDREFASIRVSFSSINVKTCSIPMTPELWAKLMETLFDELNILNWRKSYDEGHVYDGLSWFYRVSVAHAEPLISGGSELTPPLYEKLVSAFTWILHRAGLPSLLQERKWEKLEGNTQIGDYTGLLEEIARLPIYFRNPNAFEAAIVRLLDSQFINSEQLGESWCFCHEKIGRFVYGSLCPDWDKSVGPVIEELTDIRYPL